VVAGPGYAPRPEGRVLQLWDVQSGDTRAIPLPRPRGEGLLEGAIQELAFDAQGRLYSSGNDAIRRWDLEQETSEVLLEATTSHLAMSDEGQLLLAGTRTRLAGQEGTGVSEYSGMVEDLFVLDLERGSSRRIRAHGAAIQSLALGPGDEAIVTGGYDGVVRVGSITGDAPHLLVGHKTKVSAVTVSPDGRWVASGAGNEIRLWPMPDLSKPPLHTLPHDELMARLHTLTNVRVVEDETSPSGYRLDVGPFPGWKEVPEW